MKKPLLDSLQTTRHTISPTTSGLALGIGLVIGLIAAPAIAQQRPTAGVSTCSTNTQSCSNAILADGPLSVSADGNSQININGSTGSTLEQVSNSVNEQTRPEEASTPLNIGPLELNSGDRPGIGIRTDVQD